MTQHACLLHIHDASQGHGRGGGFPSSLQPCALFSWGSLSSSQRAGILGPARLQMCGFPLTFSEAGASWTELWQLLPGQGDFSSYTANLVWFCSLLLLLFLFSFLPFSPVSSSAGFSLFLSPPRPALPALPLVHAMILSIFERSTSGSAQCPSDHSPGRFHFFRFKKPVIPQCNNQISKLVLEWDEQYVNDSCLNHYTYIYCSLGMRKLWAHIYCWYKYVSLCTVEFTKHHTRK